MRKKIVKFLAMIVLFLFDTVVTLTNMIVVIAPAVITFLITAPLAYRERGFYAFGGEWVLTILVFVVSIYVWARRHDKKAKKKEVNNDEQ